MIWFARDGTTVRVQIDPKISTPVKPLWLYWECGKEIFAELLADKLSKEFRDAVTNARRIAYEEGWRDAKSRKRAKATWFSGVL